MNNKYASNLYDSSASKVIVKFLSLIFSIRLMILGNKSFSISSILESSNLGYRAVNLTDKLGLSDNSSPPYGNALEISFIAS